MRRHAEREKPFRVAFGLSGTLLMQARRYAPDLLDLWKALADTGLVEFTGETYYHSLAGLFDDARVEFRAQAVLHREAIRSLFGQTPRVFRNTEMLYNDAIADAVQDMGFAGIMTEGVDWLMAGWRSPDFVYRSPGGLPVLLRNYPPQRRHRIPLRRPDLGRLPADGGEVRWLAGRQHRPFRAAGAGL